MPILTGGGQNVGGHGGQGGSGGGHGFGEKGKYQIKNYVHLN